MVQMKAYPYPDLDSEDTEKHLERWEPVAQRWATLPFELRLKFLKLCMELTASKEELSEMCDGADLDAVAEMIIEATHMSTSTGPILAARACVSILYTGWAARHASIPASEVM